MAIDTARTIATLRGLTARFDTGIQASKPYYPTKSTIMPSAGRDEAYAGLGSVPGMREWLGDRIFNSLSAAQYTIANKEWENSIAIERVDIEDDRLGMYGLPMDELAKEAAFHPDELMFDLQVNGDSRVCMDGQYFYDTDHSWGKSGSQSNKLVSGISVPSWVASKTYSAGDIVRNGNYQYVCLIGGTAAGSGGPTTQAFGITDGGVTWNFQSIVLPTEVDFRRGYFAAQSAILGFKRDNGKTFYRPTTEPITDLLLEVPLALQEVAEKAIFKPLIDGGETNVVVNRPQRIVVIPSFTDNYTCYLHRVGQPLKPFIFQARRPLQRQMKGMDDREFKSVKFMTDARYNCGYGAWWNSVQFEFQ